MPGPIKTRLEFIFYMEKPKLTVKKLVKTLRIFEKFLDPFSIVYTNSEILTEIIKEINGNEIETTGLPEFIMNNYLTQPIIKVLEKIDVETGYLEGLRMADISVIGSYNNIFSPIRRNSLNLSDSDNIEFEKIEKKLKDFSEEKNENKKKIVKKKNVEKKIIEKEIIEKKIIEKEKSFEKEIIEKEKSFEKEIIEKEKSFEKEIIEKITEEAYETKKNIEEAYETEKNIEKAEFDEDFENTFERIQINDPQIFKKHSYPAQLNSHYKKNELDIPNTNHLKTTRNCSRLCNNVDCLIS